MTEQEEKKSVAVSALIFAFGTLLSRVLGLVRDMMTAWYFPIEVKDAFLVAFRLPNFFRRILGEGALSISFIPVFVETVHGRGNQDEARKLVNGVFSILMSISITLSLICIIFMEEILGYLLSGEGYMSVPGKFEMTVKLGRVMFSFLVLMSLYAFFMAILNSLKKFALSAVAPAMLNIAMIAAALISDRWAAPERVLAWAVIAGGILQMGILIPQVVSSGYFPKPTTAWNNPDVRQVLKSLGPSLFGMSIAQLTAMVNIHFASYLEQGTHSYLYFADRIVELPLALFVVSIGSALLPTLSKYWAQGNRDAMTETTNHYLRLIVFISLPASVGMYLLAQPIVEVLFRAQKFTLHDTLSTASVIQVYSFTLIIAGLVRILAQGFYSIKDTRTPAFAGGIALFAHIPFAYFLTNAFGLVGLSSAAVFSGGVNLLFLAVGYKKKIGSLQLRRLGAGVVKFAVCAAVMGLVLQVFPPLAHLLGTGKLAQTAALLLTIGLAILTYFAMAHALNVPEYRETYETFATKIKGKLGRVVRVRR